jgi:adenylate kinase family enzyme
MMEIDRYYETTARGDILAYINERKEKADLNWIYGCLKEMVVNNKITSQKIENIISDIENNPGLYLLDKFPRRREKLEDLKETLHHRGI